MDKIIELGCFVPSTEEPLVTLIDSDGMIKTASNEIQKHWSSMKREKDKSYLHVIALTDSNYYGPNNNGDWFEGKDLKLYHPRFVENAHIFLHHMNKDPKKSIGKPVYSFYNDNMNRVELILEIMKNNPMAFQTVQKLKMGEQIFVSMGVRVQKDICSICGNQSKTRAEYCDHLRYNMKAILPDGRQVYAINPAPLNFFDISIVAKPAEPTGWALDKVASERYTDTIFTKSSAELGEEAEWRNIKLAALDKLNAIVKSVDGDVADFDDSDIDAKELKKIKSIISNNDVIHHLDYPILPIEDMHDAGLTPGGVLRLFHATNSPISLNELGYAAGRHHIGRGYNGRHFQMMLDMLPACLRILRLNPNMIDREFHDIYNDYDNELDVYEGASFTDMLRPVAKRRIIMIEKLAGIGDPDIVFNECPVYGEYPIERRIYRHQGLPRLTRKAIDAMDNNGEGYLTEYTVQGTDGKQYLSNKYNAYAGTVGRDTAQAVRQVIGAGLALGAVGAAFSSNKLHSKFWQVPVLATGAMSALSYRPENKVIVNEGVEVPVSTLFSKKQNTLRMTKQAFEKKSGIKNNIGAAIGVGLPSVLALDYMYNKKVKNRNDPDWEHRPKSRINRLGSKAYDAVTSHPILTAAGGATAGGFAQAGIKHLLSSVK